MTSYTCKVDLQKDHFITPLRREIDSNVLNPGVSTTGGGALRRTNINFRVYKKQSRSRLARAAGQLRLLSIELSGRKCYRCLWLESV